MGTNYYIETEVCECCDRSDIIHIGKSSCGWVFSLHETEELKSLGDWIPVLLSGTIKDEYGRHMDLRTMLDNITRRSFGKKGEKDYGLWKMENGKEKFVNSGNTWQMVEGEFS